MWHWSCTEWQPALGKVKVSINQMSQPSAQPSFVNHRWNTTQLRLWFPVSSSGFRWSAFLSIFKSRERRGDQLSSSHSAVIKKKPLDYELWNSHIDVMFSLKQKQKTDVSSGWGPERRFPCAPVASPIRQVHFSPDSCRSIRGVSLARACWKGKPKKEPHPEETNKHFETVWFLRMYKLVLLSSLQASCSHRRNKHRLNPLLVTAHGEGKKAELQERCRRGKQAKNTEREEEHEFDC